MRGGWPRYALERYGLLKRWRELAGIIAEACRKVLGDGCRAVYVVGGAAEDRLTVLSDIDIAIVVGSEAPRDVEAVLSIKGRAYELGLPLEAPIDLKILSEEEFEELRRRGLYRKAIRIH